MTARLSLLWLALILALGLASQASAGTILGCGPDDAGCSVSASINGEEVASGTYSIDPETGDISLSSPIQGSSGSSSVSVNDVSGNADPILGFGIGASTGAVGDAFSITLTLPIALQGPIAANSEISYTLTALSDVGAQLAPTLFPTVLIGQELDTSIGGLPPLDKGVGAGDTFFFVGGPQTLNSPVYTNSNNFVGDLQYDLMSITVAFSLSAQTTAGLSGFVQQLEVIPEPGTGLLLGFGLLVLARRRSV